ncbi:DgyrCDS9783 [Dimorphilus gyrociliatus]|uniref:Dual specificity protein phosphatase 23 n=1 Tax=Dimorphilus gyrociliatus TaxID=2664684 RepID=A0A7I8W062_9ANNE|nr:DgyrCDS9783 [Dimorphilus gyrociliatus]
MTQPGNFSWVEPNLLAGSAQPEHHDHYDFYKQQGITHLVSLTKDKPKNLPENDDTFTWSHIAMPDFTPPSVEQIEQFVSIVDQAKKQGTKVAVHCRMGQGRTGTMLACYYGKDRELQGDEAIKKIREMRPISVETQEQEEIVRHYLEQKNLKN